LKIAQKSVSLVKILLLMALCHINILAENFPEELLEKAPAASQSWISSQKLKSLLIETQKKGAILLYDLENGKFKEDSEAAENALISFFRDSRKKQLKIKHAVYGNCK